MPLAPLRKDAPARSWLYPFAGAARHPSRQNSGSKVALLSLIHIFQPLLAWHKIRPDQLVVVHDELDIPAGELRFKKGGGNAGHNGLKSITQLLGTPDFYRLRIGIGRPPQKGDVINWVLGRPCSEDADKIRTVTDKALEVLEIFAKKGLEAAVRATRS